MTEKKRKKIILAGRKHLWLAAHNRSLPILSRANMKAVIS